MNKFLIAFAFLSCGSLFGQDRAFSKVEVHMGSAFEIIVVSNEADSTRAYLALDSAYSLVAHIEKRISSWDQDSESSLINAKAWTGPVPVSKDLFELIRRSKKVSELTNGAFDISFASANNLWKFDGTMAALPDSADVLSNISSVDHRKIKLNDKDLSVRFLISGMRIGFGGIGKGYAAKEASDLLKRMGFKGGVVNAGGDLYAWGLNEEQRKWRVGVADPTEKGRMIAWLEVENMSVVTSGDYERFAMINGIRYAHIIDPRTGWPVGHCKSVTLLCPDPELADALATAVFVLGPEVGMDLIEQLDSIECLIIDPEDNMLMSKGLQKSLILEGE